MRMVDIIEKKRDGKELSTEEIQFFVKGYTEGTIPDYQAASLLMAIYFQDMTERERTDLTLAMVESGDTIDLSLIEGIKCDKHSTGGVGDKVTLCLSPMVAACGVPVAKMSGRGLGHTGGTIDKLESIPGFQVELTSEQFIQQVNDIKMAVVSQSGNLTPADKKIYALRDVTGTVPSIPLIASSIMSKKIASGADAIVLDVKVGEGAFMKTVKEAEELAHAMVTIGNRVGRKTIAILSDMSQPLGYAVGNALEVKEAIDVLKGEGPEDVKELCLTLGSYMVFLSGKAPSIEKAREMLKDVLNSGKGLETFKAFIKAQGGNTAIVDHPKLLPQAKYKIEIPAEQSGYIKKIVANEIGVAAMLLGAGRETKDSSIDLSVGIVLNKKVGDFVEKGETLATIYSNKENIEEIKEKIYSNILVINDKVDKPALIKGIIAE
ncbi:pyrimidine-nucleoside phosphorylase [Ureibacillus thermophilus]|uniref:Pyrimidine-nucleoside phosphorylase n=1 Tax=Ureibacillus thermophilus TaxID=367743 RepID=A0A4P6US02_9BACL|nr:pyrimidine-nucleoside phosphorylase [Ureibacillus thermophilus]QBK25804.1 pyrimidine-nucleoside phosphorylase [Ureibacillus thermophilus]